jgi:hypothetical protein
MEKKNEKPGRLAKSLIETAKDMRQAGIIDEKSYEKITLCHLDAKEKSTDVRN